MKYKYPLLEYDSSFQAIIQPSKDDYSFTLPRLCVAIFFKDVVDYMSTMPFVHEIGRVKWETGDVIYYVYKKDQIEFCFYHSWVGASISAAVLDLTIALGVTQIIACGGCGVLMSSILEGEYLIPTSGIRDEGTSFHYIAPSREITCDSLLLQNLMSFLSRNNIKFTKVKTWTTDGFYRETENRRAIRVNEGCVTVDMEFSALCAVAKFRGVEFAQIFYAGDIVVDAISYDERNWQEDAKTRSSLLNVIINFVKEIL